MEHAGGAVLAALMLMVSVQGAERGNSRQSLFQQDWESFQKTEAAQQEVNPENVQTNLISAAVLHATNAQRKQNGLPVLKHSGGAQKAAAMQARIMRERGSISHVNPEEPKLRTLEDRVKAAGLDYQFIAENVATAFGLEYESGKPFFTRTKEGKEVYSYRPGGEPIPRHTYASFAEALVRNWMESPGHRKNILQEAAAYMGASCLPAKDEKGMSQFFCAQVFYTPLRE